MVLADIIAPESVGETGESEDRSVRDGVVLGWDEWQGALFLREEDEVDVPASADVVKGMADD
jgi:hypothetical protein